MAIGDILSATIRGDGFSADVKIAQFLTGCTYNYGSLALDPPRLTNPTVVFTVTGSGSNGSAAIGAITRTIAGTIVPRKPYPDVAVLDERITEGDLFVRVALEEPIYAGETVSVSIVAGWATNTAGAGEQSAAVTNLECVNNAVGNTYNKIMPIGQWDPYLTRPYFRAAAGFTVAVVAYALFGVGCARITATGATSGYSVSAVKPHTTLCHASAANKFYEAYTLTVTDEQAANFTQGEEIVLRHEIFPSVGDATAIRDSANYTTATDRITGKTAVARYCDKTAALQIHAVVALDGSDTTGAVSAVSKEAAALTPYATVGKALAAGARNVWLRAGAGYDWLGSTPVSVAATNYFIEVRPWPGESVTLTRAGTWKSYKASKLAYIGFSEIACSAANAYLDGANSGGLVWLEGNTFNTTVAQTVGNGYRSDGCYVVNNSGLGLDYFGGSSTTRNGYTLWGNAGSAPVTISAAYAVVANTLTGGNTANAGRITEKATANPAPQQDNFLMVNTSLTNFHVSSGSGGPVYFGNANAMNGAAFIGNLIEVRTATAPSGPAFYLGGDSAMTELNNIIVAGNTVAGERCNLFYNDDGTTANVRTNIAIAHNAYRSTNIKSDDFNKPGVGPNGARIGNHAQMFGVLISDNRYDGAEGASFVPYWIGVNCKYLDGPDSTHGQLGWTNDASADGTGLGGGDYTPTANSALVGHTFRRQYGTWDFNGTLINGTIGAVQRAAAAVSHSTAAPQLRRRGRR